MSKLDYALFTVERNYKSLNERQDKSLKEAKKSESDYKKNSLLLLKDIQDTFINLSDGAETNENIEIINNESGELFAKVEDFICLFDKKIEDTKQEFIKYSVLNNNYFEITQSLINTIHKNHFWVYQKQKNMTNLNKT